MAASIGANDLHERLDLDLPNDELGRLAQTFDAMLARMEDAFARQTRFSGDAAHELRTPLTLMRGQIDLALNHPRTPDEYREALGQLDLDLARITSLVETLLALARADAGQLAPDLSPFDLADTIGTILDLYDDAATAAGIAMRGACQSLTVTADEDLIIQVLVNLVDNALAHTPPGGEIAIECVQQANLAVITVADNGSGIPEEHQDRVFDRFYRVGHTHQRGAGLGLAIARAIVERHGGTIHLASVEGTGTTIELRLPLAAF
jgi:heavy metal sensor kinase